jgi:hypothetical protein
VRFEKITKNALAYHNAGVVHVVADSKVVALAPGVTKACKNSLTGLPDFSYKISKREKYTN